MAADNKPTEITNSDGPVGNEIHWVDEELRPAKAKKTDAGPEEVRHNEVIIKVLSCTPYGDNLH